MRRRKTIMETVTRPVMDLKTFMELEDKDLQKFIYSHETIPILTGIHKIDSDEKIAYYYFDKSLKINNRGGFYVKSDLKQWIVYNKNTKKVKISNNHLDVMCEILKDYFSEPDFVGKFLLKLTPTLCKKIIEGKIHSIADIISYHRSYTLKRKNIPLVTIFRFLSAGMEYRELLHVLEDPENVESIGQLRRINEIVPHGYLHLKPFKIKISEVDKLTDLYDRWIRDQNKKYVALFGQGNGKDGSYALTQTTF